MKIDALNPSLANSVLKPQEKSGQADFSEMLENFIADVNGDLQASSEAQKRLMDGKVDNMVEMMSTIEKADISLRLATEVRNKALEAYQEIMRMQV